MSDTTDVDFSTIMAEAAAEAPAEAQVATTPVEEPAAAHVEPEDGEEPEDGDDEGWEDAADPEDEEESDDLPPDPSDDRESWRKNRLNVVKEQRDAARKEAAAAKAEAAELKARYEAAQAQAPAQAQPTPAGMPTPAQIQQYVASRDPVVLELAQRVEAIRANQDKFADAGSYTDAISEALTEYKTELKVRSMQIQQDLANREATKTKTSTDYVQGLLDNYEAVTKASTIPKIEVYKARLVKHAGDLHPMIREAVLTHDRPDLATAAVTSNRAAFDWLVEQSRRAGNGPLSPRAVAYVGELVAGYKARKGAPAPATSTQPPKVKSSTPPVPRALRSTSSSRSTSVGKDEDPFAYASRVLRGEIKDPTLR